jgi:hypothetical protein
MILVVGVSVEHQNQHPLPVREYGEAVFMDKNIFELVVSLIRQIVYRRIKLSL